MRKLRRALALALTAVLFLGTFTASSAAVKADENAVTGTIKISSLPVCKVLNTTARGVALPTLSFYARMTPLAADGSEETIGGIKPETGHALKNNIAEFDFDKNDRTDREKITKESAFTFDFAEPFTHTGIYMYTVEEVVKNVSYDANGKEVVSYTEPPTESDDREYYITYDYTKYTVYLYVSELKGEYVVSSIAVYKDGNEKPDDMVFQNTIRCANITIQKFVDGTEFTKNEDFDFYILIPEEGDTITLTEYDTVQAQKYDEDGNEVGGVFTLDVRGSDINADVITYGSHFTLKDGEYIVITAPVSMIYKVMEVVPTEENYETSFEYEEFGYYTGSKTSDQALNEHSSYDGDKTYVETKSVTLDGKNIMENCAWVKGTTNTKFNSVTFTNQRDYKVPTGVNLDLIPYIAVLLIAGIAAVLFIFRKKAR